MTTCEPMTGLLDAAWAEAERYLPDGWVLQLGLWKGGGTLEYEATASPYAHDPNEVVCIGQGDTPDKAVLQLAAELVVRAETER